MKRRELIEKGVTLGMLACVPAAWDWSPPAPAPAAPLAPAPPATEGPFWLLPAGPWPHFRICTEYPFGPQLPCCYPDLWRTERISYWRDRTQVTLRPYFDPAAHRIQLRLPRITDLSWSHGHSPSRPREGWGYLWLGQGRPWRPPGPSERTRQHLVARFDTLMRGHGDQLEQLPRAWWSSYDRAEEE